MFGYRKSIIFNGSNEPLPIAIKISFGLEIYSFLKLFNFFTELSKLNFLSIC